MKKFETGIGYISGKAYGEDTIGYMNIESRTAKYAVVNDVDFGKKRCKIHVYDNCEAIYYDDITVYRADRTF